MYLMVHILCHIEKILKVHMSTRQNSLLDASQIILLNQTAFCQIIGVIIWSVQFIWFGISGELEQGMC